MSAPGADRRPIRRLEGAVVREIAAGEVVERPSSVVKELVENAVDAGATSVIVRLSGGGLERIEVADDGEGIPAGELELAVERHATSKIDPGGPVDRIGTLGFRGEALAAIASVSRFRLLSRPRDAEVAAGLSVVGGQVAGRFLAPRAVGTTVEVDDLFFNTPARRKFLRSPPVEQADILGAVERQYLARPDTTYRVESEERVIASYPGTPDLRDAAARVLGLGFRTQSFAVLEDLPGGGHLRAILGTPAVASGSARGLYVVVNGRAVNGRAVQQAVRIAYRDYVPKSRYPVGVVYLDVPPSAVDVNVHPTKRDVRLLDEREWTEAVRRATRAALVEEPARAAELVVRREEAPPSASAEPAGGRALGVAEAFARMGGPVRAGSQRRLDTEPMAAVVRTGPGRSPVSLIGCVQRLYWIAETGDAMLLIDQHAASERLLFDLLKRTGHLVRQELVEPVTVELTARQAATLQEHAEAVRGAGFDLEPFGPTSYRIRAVPEWLGHRATPESVVALLQELGEGGRPTVPDGAQERTQATIACHAAIRAGDVVAREEMVRVLDALYASSETAYACPHGRPIVFRLPRSRLDRWFLRSGT